MAGGFVGRGLPPPLQRIASRLALATLVADTTRVGLGRIWCNFAVSWNGISRLCMVVCKTKVNPVLNGVSPNLCEQNASFCWFYQVFISSFGGERIPGQLVHSFRLVVVTGVALFGLSGSGFSVWHVVPGNHLRFSKNWGMTIVNISIR